MKALNLSPAELELLKKGMAASLAGEKPQYDIQQYGPKLQARAEAQAGVAAAGEKAKSAAFRDAAAAEPGAVKTASGLVNMTITPGNGPTPKATDPVNVHYHGTLPDGTVFDSSVQRGEPATSAEPRDPLLDGGRPADEGRGKGEARLPGRAGLRRPGRPSGHRSGSTLVFEVELLEIKGK